MSDKAAPRYPVTPGDFTTAEYGVTPSQTVGPYWHIGLPWKDGPDAVPEGVPGRITLLITMIDGEKVPIADAMVETWQADAAGRFAHPDDPRGSATPTPAGFRGFARAGTDATGTAAIHTVKPGELPAEDDTVEAPHVNLGIFARGMLDRLFTRMYFPEDTAAHATDPVLASLPDSQRTKLVATKTDDGYSLTVYVQDNDPDGVETPFFEL
ncbi:protocatechuate 3,4-dioxygenase subunit alpha [Rhodococcus rhodnii]|uniref:Protocatechuate dioxygenase alpha subunit n=2 Tax=Rhodococcus rhodnii TaxID=38312 RepID=R7WNU7_9NOCA|nr:protocatechuate 3,4-dioxygenase subunit alpha [Rhodococcus rhodnii]EOM76945.1 protocatechuate dioxygenase alpha subunit [Rhodococcus rhodnii LMG 5362]TXG89830.1 protocatechuate 3,4-dioxygenase subunit alpha [Rhodococcus rhodnii]